ncbi:hypothetical protein AQ611_22020 [Burkholderia singularis]|nr:hypothetical protein AQ611_22020 [Burkholderia sp. Bp7605]
MPRAAVVARRACPPCRVLRGYCKSNATRTQAGRQPGGGGHACGRSARVRLLRLFGSYVLI